MKRGLRAILAAERDKHFKGFKRKYPRFVKDNKVIFPVEDSLLAKYPGLLCSSTHMIKARPPFRGLDNGVEGSVMTDLIMVTDFVDNFGNLFEMPAFTPDILYDAFETENDLLVKLSSTLVKKHISYLSNLCLTNGDTKGELLGPNLLLKIIHTSRKCINLDSLFPLLYPHLLSALITCPAWDDYFQENAGLELGDSTHSAMRKFGQGVRWELCSTRDKLELIRFLIDCLWEDREIHDELAVRLERKKEAEREKLGCVRQKAGMGKGKGRGRGNYRQEVKELTCKIKECEKEISGIKLGESYLGMDAEWNEYYLFNFDLKNIWIKSPEVALRRSSKPKPTPAAKIARSLSHGQLIISACNETLTVSSIVEPCLPLTPSPTKRHSKAMLSYRWYTYPTASLSTLHKSMNSKGIRESALSERLAAVYQIFNASSNSEGKSQVEVGRKLHFGGEIKIQNENEAETENKEHENVTVSITQRESELESTSGDSEVRSGGSENYENGNAVENEGRNEPENMEVEEEQQEQKEEEEKSEIMEVEYEYLKQETKDITITTITAKLTELTEKLTPYLPTELQLPPLPSDLTLEALRDHLLSLSEISISPLQHIQPQPDPDTPTDLLSQPPPSKFLKSSLRIWTGTGELHALWKNYLNSLPIENFSELLTLPLLFLCIYIFEQLIDRFIAKKRQALARLMELSCPYMDSMSSNGNRTRNGNRNSDRNRNTHNVPIVIPKRRSSRIAQRVREHPKVVEPAQACRICEDYGDVIKCSGCLKYAHIDCLPRDRRRKISVAWVLHLQGIDEDEGEGYRLGDSGVVVSWRCERCEEIPIRPCRERRRLRRYGEAL